MQQLDGERPVGSMVRATKPASAPSARLIVVERGPERARRARLGAHCPARWWGETGLWSARRLGVEEQIFQVQVARMAWMKWFRRWRGRRRLRDHPERTARVGQRMPEAMAGARPWMRGTRGVHVVGESGRSADAGDEHHLLPGRVHVGQEVWHRGQDRGSPAAGDQRTPGRPGSRPGCSALAPVSVMARPFSTILSTSRV